MRDLLAGIIGVPAAMLVAGGLGIVGLTVVSRVRGRREPPLRWAHMVFGMAMAAAGLLVVQLALWISPPH